MSVHGDLSQTVKINGVARFVHDLSVETGDHEVPRVSFGLEAFVGAPVAPQIGDTVEITQTIDGDTFSLTAEVSTVHQKRRQTFTFWAVEALGERNLARRYRFFREWHRRQSVTEVILEAWEAYGPPGVSLAGVLNNSERMGFSSVFGSLFDLMEAAAEQTGWAWDIRAGVLEFAPVPAGPTVKQADGDLVGGTLNLTTTLDGVYNVARRPAWEAKTRIFVGQISVDECVRHLETDIDLKEWQLANDPVILTDPWTETEVTVDELGVLRFHPYLACTQEADAGPFEVRVSLRRRVWVERSNEASITLYGRREAPPLPDDGGSRPDQVAAAVETYLRRVAFPPVRLSADATRADIRPGTLCPVELTDPALARSLFVARVIRTTNKTELFVHFEAVSPENDDGRAVLVDPNPLPEIVRRLDRLERAPLHPGGFAGREAWDIGVIKGQVDMGATVEVDGGMEAGAVQVTNTGATVEIDGGTTN